MRVRPRLFPTALLLVASACNCGQRVQKVDPALGDVPSQLDFGLVAVGDKATRTLTLEALTSADLTLDAHIEEADAPFALVPAAPDTIGGNGSVTLTVVYTPTKVGIDSATLDINTNDPDATRGRKRVLLGGQGDSPQISVTPDQLMLTATACPDGALSGSCHDAQGFTIENIGQVTLSLGTVDLEPIDDAHPLPPASQLGIAPLVSTSSLEAGEKIDSQIVWTPSPSLLTGGVAQDFQAKLVVPSNDPAHPSIEIPITAHADPNLPPQACVTVSKVTQTIYHYDPQTDSAPVPQQVTLDKTEYDCSANPALNCPSGQFAVRPGSVVTLASLATCTFDPEGDALTYSWNTDFAPEDPTATPPIQSRAEVTAGVPPATGTIQLDAEGSYTVTLVVKDNLGQPASANVVLNAVPRDDLSVQLSWQDAPGVDLDLHLLVDAPPPDVTVPASMFCLQDCFWANPSPYVFTSQPNSFDAVPHLLRDDQGTAGQLESTSLVSAPPGSKFRIAVHVYDQGNMSQPITPSVDVRLKNQSFPTLTPTVPLSGTGDVWLAAEVDFPTAATDTPTLTPLDLHLTPTDDPNPGPTEYRPYDGTVGACP